MKNDGLSIVLEGFEGAGGKGGGKGIGWGIEVVPGARGGTQRGKKGRKPCKKCGFDRLGSAAQGNLRR